ncbi:MAG: hypothetical protein ONB44_07310 [candidate division KSB1 bacterium]|nr:hypothetical protein [candidate division KSB1 bacterium]
MENDGAFQADSDLPSRTELQRLLAKLNDKLLAAFAREALPEIVTALHENDLAKIHELLGDWIATFEEYAHPGAVAKISRAAKDIGKGGGIPWEEVQDLIKMG